MRHYGKDDDDPAPAEGEPETGHEFTIEISLHQNISDTPDHGDPLYAEP